MRFSRRSALKLSVVIAPIAGLKTGDEERIWMAFTHDGLEVTERLPVAFRWNSVLLVTLKEGNRFRTNGCAAFFQAEGGDPFSTKDFEVIQVVPECSVELGWTFQREDPS
jgi:hypothetical protein